MRHAVCLGTNQIARFVYHMILLHKDGPHIVLLVTTIPSYLPDIFLFNFAQKSILKTNMDVTNN